MKSEEKDSFHVMECTHPLLQTQRHQAFRQTINETNKLDAPREVLQLFVDFLFGQRPQRAALQLPYAPYAP